MGHAAPVKGDGRTATEKSAGSASGPTEDAVMIAPEVTEKDLRRCNMCAEPFVKLRARRQEHGHGGSGSECDSSFADTTQANRSWICTCKAFQRHVCTDRHAREIGTALATRATEPHFSTSPTRARDRREPRALAPPAFKDLPAPPAADNLMDPERIGLQVCSSSTASPRPSEASSESQHTSSNSEVVEKRLAILNLT